MGRRVAAMTTANDILTRARSKIGVTEHPRGSNCNEFGARYGFNCVQWCSEFVWDTFNACGIDLKREVAGGYAQCSAALAGFRRKGWVLGNKREARGGDIVFYDFTGIGVTHHTGIFERSSSFSTFYAIEGNTSDRGSQTNGGAVLHKQRGWGSVLAVARYPLGGPPVTTPGPFPSPSPIQQLPPDDDEDDMKIIRFSDGGIWLFSGLFRLHVSDGHHVDVLKYMGVPYSEVNDTGAQWVLFACTQEIHGG